MDSCLNPAKSVPLPRNPSSTPPDLPGLAQINLPWLSSQVPSAWTTSKCLVVSAGNHVCLFSRDLCGSGSSPGDIKQAAETLEQVMEVRNGSPLTIWDDSWKSGCAYAMTFLLSKADQEPSFLSPAAEDPQVRLGLGLSIEWNIEDLTEQSEVGSGMKQELQARAEGTDRSSFDNYETGQYTVM
ncbi:hypothetical protein E4T56_gene6498 [Termitomyces sp. T112]|nr:hypothetical protein E4T56_gene6498 [Termitomyces sp. T112]